MTFEELASWARAVASLPQPTLEVVSNVRVTFFQKPQPKGCATKEKGAAEAAPFVGSQSFGLAVEDVQRRAWGVSRFGGIAGCDWLTFEVTDLAAEQAVPA